MANWFRAIGKQLDLVAVAAFCAIGLMIWFAASAELPDFTTTVAQIYLTP